MARLSLEARINHLERSLKLYGRLERAGKKAKLDVAEAVRDEIRGEIHSRSGQLAASWEGVVVAGDPIVRSTGLARAKASVAGAYIRPRRRRALRLADGRVRRGPIRIRPGAWIGRPRSKQSYVDVVLKRAPDVIERVLERRFRTLAD